MPNLNRADPYNLQRFITAQEHVYHQALVEIQRGHKKTHWMWFIFPQFAGLGFSSTSRLYAIESLAEALQYLEHPLLGPRLIECAEAALHVEGKTAHDIFGSPDDMKFKSSATLFAHVAPADSVFEELLAKYFLGERDEKTEQLLSEQK
jgi:uncharacterized protein (DUF1810 family)